jgi:hypothetical protein
MHGEGDGPVRLCAQTAERLVGSSAGSTRAVPPDKQREWII